MIKWIPRSAYKYRVRYHSSCGPAAFSIYPANPEWPGNVHAIYEPHVASLYHITTTRGPDGTYIAFLSKQDNVAKALSNPSPLSSEPRSSRSAAMLSLLEATEQRIHEMLVKSNPMRDNHGKKNSNTVSTPDSKVTRTPTNDEVSIDYGEKPKEKGFMTPWKKHMRVESAYARKVCN